MNKDELLEKYHNGERDFSGVDLHGADLSGVDLSGVDLSGTDLSGAILSGAILYRADLPGANLYGADLHDADLYRADLSDANLHGAYLYGANLSSANLHGAYLSSARLNWFAHNLIAEILRQASGEDIEKCEVAGFILIRHDLCWEDFLALGDPLQDWALDVLRPWAKDDPNAPNVLREAKTDG